MATPDLIMKRFDTYPPLQAGLLSGGAPIDLTTAVSVKVILKGALGGIVTGVCTVPNPTQAPQVSYQWAANDLSVIDTYNVEFEINWGGSSPVKLQTVPNSTYNVIQVIADLEGA